MKVGRITTAVVMVIAVLWAPQIQNFPSLWNDLQSILAYATPPIVKRTAYGVLRRGANNTQYAILSTQCHPMAQH